MGTLARFAHEVSPRATIQLVLNLTLVLCCCEMDGLKSPWTKVVGISYWETWRDSPTMWVAEYDWQGKEVISPGIGVYEMAYFVVRWGHDGLLDGPDSPLSAATLGPPHQTLCPALNPEHEIVVTGFTGPIDQRTEERMKQESYLQTRMLGPKVRPIRLEVESNQGGVKLRFLFSRKDSVGVPVIDPRASTVAFVYAEREFKLKAKFNLKEITCPDGTIP